MLLRAIEWRTFPEFVTQPVIPVLFIFVQWYFVLTGLIVLSVTWAFVRGRFFAPGISGRSVLFVRLLALPSAVVCCAILALRADYLSAVLALLWPALAALIGIPSSYVAAVFGIRDTIGSIERLVADRMGMVPRHSSSSSSKAQP
jgi:hypothetical protein